MEQRQLLSGNEAIARGAWEAGCGFGSGYPGTPSSEILPALAELGDCYTEWSVNEKCALEAAAGAAIVGARCLVTMKHVGLNVAADPLFTLAYTGINGGLVVVSADDPSMHSSQNEQDNRHYARAAKVPMLEPASSQEALDFTKLAFEISERFDTPVLLRVTTRICHSHGVVSVGERSVKQPACPPQPQVAKYVMLPVHARQRRALMAQRVASLRRYVESAQVNRREAGDPAVGIISAGVAYQYAKEVCPGASFLKLGMTWPLPEQMIRDFAASVQKLYVIEELDPYLAEQVQAMGVAVTPLPESLQEGELNPERVKAALEGSPPGPQSAPDLPARPPQLCPGCPHRGVFMALHRLRLFVTGDIGCYTLGALPPLQALHTCMCMGAGVGQIHGINQACGAGQRAVAVIGDSTFVHSGITNLINIFYNNSPSVVIILDNATTAMTGGQDHPGTGRTLHGGPGRKLDLAALCQGIGIRHVQTVDPYDFKQTQAAIKAAVERDEPSVIIASRPCVLLSRQRGRPFVVDEESCTQCGVCLQVGCPAIISSPTAAGRRQPQIDPLLCSGCGLCAQVCPQDAIRQAGDTA